FNCAFDYSIMCYSIELCERIMDTLIKQYIGHKAQTELAPLMSTMSFNLTNSIEICNSNICHLLFNCFFAGIKDLRSTTMMSTLGIHNLSYRSKCCTILSLTSVSLAIKLHGNSNSYSRCRPQK